MRKALCFFMSLLLAITYSKSVFSQCNQTIGANTMIVSTNTLIAVGVNDAYANYLVCPGVTLTYRDNSQSDTIYLEQYATLIFDSATSYGYATVYAKPLSVFDANNRQYVKLYYQSGSTLKDTLTFAGFNVSCGSISYSYTKLSNGIGCISSVSDEAALENDFDVRVTATEIKISSKQSTGNFTCEIFDISGRRVVNENTDIGLNISTAKFIGGIYLLKISVNDNVFLKKIFVE